MPTIPADVAFQHCANLAALAYDHRPPYVTYEVLTRARAPSMNQDRSVDRAVMVRSRDDLALVQDLPQGRNMLARSFPLSPTFDALSYFRFEWHVSGRGTLDAYVADVVPLRYREQSTNVRADVFVASLRYYKASYADDSSDDPAGLTHIALRAYDFVKSEGTHSTLYYTDVYIDNASGLPRQVNMAGDNGLLFDVSYELLQNYWVIDKIEYEETILAPLNLARFHVIADAKFTKYTFPQDAPDPRLAEPPAFPTPVPSGPVPFPSQSLAPQPATIATPVPAR